VTNVRAACSLFFLLLAVFAMTLFFAQGSLAPEALCQWDCGWYRAILAQGYVSTIPPIAQSPDQANVAFFPLYPFVARGFSRLFDGSASVALPLLSIVFAFGTFYLGARLLEVYGDPSARKKLVLLAAYPATFFLFVGYSESLYIFFLFLALYAAKRAGDPTRDLGGDSKSVSPKAWLLILAFAAFFLGLTRLTGFVIGTGAALVLLAVALLSRTRSFAFEFPRTGRAPFVWAVFSSLGVATFFAYCQTRFGAWDLYFRTLDIGWHKEFSVPGFFHYFFRAVQKNVLPHWFAKDPIRMSWIVTADTLIALIYALSLEGSRLWRERRTIVKGRWLRYGILSAAFVHLLITTMGDSGGYHHWRNGMRYTMPVFFLVVLLWDSSWIPRWLEERPRLRKGLEYAVLALFAPYQVYYFWLFIQGAWVS
jgi:hypothetical protein